MVIVHKKHNIKTAEEQHSGFTLDDGDDESGHRSANGPTIGHEMVERKLKIEFS